MTFEPRHAHEPGQEFGYTTTEDIEVEKGEDAPEGAILVSRDPETGVEVWRRDGVERTLKADGDGLVHPKTAADDAILASFGLAIAHEKAAKKAEASAKAKE